MRADGETNETSHVAGVSQQSETAQCCFAFHQKFESAPLIDKLKVYNAIYAKQMLAIRSR